MLRERPVRREREVNWGDRTRLRGNEQKTLAWVSVAESQPMTLYAAGEVRPADSLAVFLVHIEWGHGGASVDQEFPVIGRLRVPLVGSMVKVSGRLVSSSGRPAPESVSGELSVVIAPGSDGETLRNTRWVVQHGSSGVVSQGPERVMGFEGHNLGPDTWFMALDGRGEDGEEPVMTCSVRRHERFVLRRPHSHGFRSAVRWHASTTPLVLARDAAAMLRVEAELLL